jgi:hypothetical protein
MRHLPRSNAQRENDTIIAFVLLLSALFWILFMRSA